MRSHFIAGLVIAILVDFTIAAADLLFWNNMTYNEYRRSTTVLNYTGMLAYTSSITRTG